MIPNVPPPNVAPRRGGVRWDVLGEAWSVLWANPLPYVTATVPLVLGGFIAFWGSLLPRVNAVLSQDPNAAFRQFLLDLVVVGALVAGAAWLVAAMARATISGQPVTRRLIYSVPASGGRPLGAWFVRTVVTVAGLLLCFLPGIVAQGALLIAPTLAAREGLGAVDATAASVERLRGSYGTVVGVWFVAWLFCALSACCGGVGLVVGLPYLAIVTALVARDVSPDTELSPGPSVL